MKTQLIMLETPIIVSDEDIELGDWAYDTKHNESGHIYGQIFCKKIRFDSNDVWYRKIIAGIEGLPSIDWNGLEEEFGWVDVEKLAQLYSKSKYETTTAYTSFVDGFKKAQSLNKKKFSLEDIKKAYARGWMNRLNNTKIFKDEQDELIQSLQQSKVFDIEVEMEFDGEDKACDDKCEWGQCHSIAECRYVDESVYKPKITNNSIKIIKKL